MLHMFIPGFLLIAAGCHLPFAWWWRERMLHGVDRNQRDAVLRDLHGRWTLLVVIWAIALLAVAGWLLVDWRAILSGHRTGPVTWAALLLFHGIWWPLVMPVLQRLDQALRAHGVLAPAAFPGPARSATLKPRRVSDYLPGWSGGGEVAVLAVAATVLAVRTLTAETIEPHLAWGAAIFVLMGLLFVGAYAFWIRMETQQSYAMFVPAASEAEIEGLRRFRVRLVYAGQLAMASASFAAGWLLIEVARGTIAEPTAGIIGGAMGGLVGLAGGIAGTLASLRAAKLQRNHPGQRH